MAYSLIYHPDVKDDIKKFDSKLKQRVAEAIEQRLTTEPEKYGKPLRKSLKGYWKLRVGDIRIVFKIQKSEIVVLAILNRKDVYERINKRID
ncbi:MAG: type II toxin-antitoxin system RelE/ParE family toxin [Candidatus Dadabacteria bacterium]|nr:type II toxin-antitoxin system RelE/ParE family toxin [Candidatus Dadabacteria bacterium]NIV42096.1 type II toxin-antitoxin system mRNA interferase toxin, RelE/StbE family [Candidatus Dadabacteria bacterium]NIX16425.1 type II toxin-antitoxin system mRNA interferase toxin, RelE/StbE family [Candidatus Dadabacteria bacterium]